MAFDFAYPLLGCLFHRLKLSSMSATPRFHALFDALTRARQQPATHLVEQEAVRAQYEALTGTVLDPVWLNGVLSAWSPRSEADALLVEVFPAPPVRRTWPRRVLAMPLGITSIASWQCRRRRALSLEVVGLVVGLLSFIAVGVVLHGSMQSASGMSAIAPVVHGLLATTLGGLIVGMLGGMRAISLRPARMTGIDQLTWQALPVTRSYLAQRPADVPLLVGELIQLREAVRCSNLAEAVSHHQGLGKV